MFCRECGKEIANDSQVCGFCGVPVGVGNKFCPNCGETVDEQAVFCVKCGCSFAQAGSQQPNDQQYQQQYQQPNGQQYQQQYQQPNGQQYQQGAPGYGYQQPCQQPYVDPNLKSKIAAGILGILLGAFGAHNFYLGFTGKAVAQLLITVLSCGTLSVVSAVWGLVEGIMILTNPSPLDAQGRPLRD